VAGIFHTDTILGIEQKSHGQVEAMLNSRNDDDLICAARDSSRRSKVLGDGLSQWTIAAGIAVYE